MVVVLGCSEIWWSGGVVGWRHGWWPWVGEVYKMLIPRSLPFFRTMFGQSCPAQLLNSARLASVYPHPADNLSTYEACKYYAMASTS